jgi:hypothetical protein
MMLHAGHNADTVVRFQLQFAVVVVVNVLLSLAHLGRTPPVPQGLSAVFACGIL